MGRRGARLAPTRAHVWPMAASRWRQTLRRRGHSTTRLTVLHHWPRRAAHAGRRIPQSGRCTVGSVMALSPSALVRGAAQAASRSGRRSVHRRMIRAFPGGPGDPAVDRRPIVVVIAHQNIPCAHRDSPEPPAHPARRPPRSPGASIQSRLRSHRRCCSSTSWSCDERTPRRRLVPPANAG